MLWYDFKSFNLVKLEKCEFHVSQIMFLGFAISAHWPM